MCDVGNTELKKLFRRIAEEAAIGFVDLQKPPIRADNGHADSGMIEDAAKARFAFLKNLLRVPPLGHISKHQHDAACFARVIQNRRAACLNERFAPVPRQQQGARRQRGGVVALRRTLGLTLDWPARVGPNSAKDFAQITPARLVFGPAGQRLSNRIHKRDTPAGINCNDRIADALQRRDKPLTALRRVRLWRVRLCARPPVARPIVARPPVARESRRRKKSAALSWCGADGL